MGTPFVVNGSLSFPPAPGVPSLPIPFTFSGQFNNDANSILTLIGTGTQVVSLGTVPSTGLLVLLVMVDAVSPTTPGVAPSPVLVKINSSVTPEEISAGGVKLLINPAPVAGITSLSITYSSDVRVRVWALS